MLSEAASTGKPVYRLSMLGKAGKFKSFYTYMEQRDAIKPFKGVLDNFNYRPLKDAEMIATVIRSEISTKDNEH
jgi:Predicted nucleoside-diphosphate-sugar epimerase